MAGYLHWYIKTLPLAYAVCFCELTKSIPRHRRAMRAAYEEKDLDDRLEEEEKTVTCMIKMI
jgi:hypothetical protein